ncbi:hypothetical protein EXIGLDRAFT_728194 [Exidia glandulosa HHB12029]|uniref:Uncharacterized protein n=1 Tax=Exidia glandulosa HHB12029 TaxID=1314781 RepID=A0A165D0U6_EXIGL|nr:hypothetical protein EXIGLDRAFT_728194 [Exidia glandulosa HHB12029]
MPASWFTKVANSAKRLSFSRASTSSTSSVSTGTSTSTSSAPTSPDEDLLACTDEDDEDTTPPGGGTHSTPLPPLRAVERLPAELWLAILDLATALPHDPLRSDSHLGFEPNLCYPAALLAPIYTRSQATRLALSFTSRHLLQVCLPTVYAYAWLHKRAQARRLALTLDLHPERGAWVRRVDIDCLAVRNEAMQASALDIKLVLKSCCNITTLLDKRATYVNVGDPLAHWTAMLLPLSTLRRVRMTHYGERAKFANVLLSLGSVVGQLEVLEVDLGSMDFVHPDEEALLSLSSSSMFGDFRSLHTLDIVLSEHVDESDAYLRAFRTWNLPLLSTLRILGRFSPTLALKAFIQKHGAGVKVLELGRLASSTDALHPQPVFEQGEEEWSVDEVLFPRLEILVCTATRAHNIPHPLVKGHETLKALWLRNLERKVRDQHSATVLAQLQKVFPVTGGGKFPLLEEQIRSLTYGESPMARMTRDSEVLILQLFWKRFVEAANKECPPLRVTDIWGRPVPLRTGEKERGWGHPIKEIPKGLWAWPDDVPF